jgi:cysteine-rich repeat protein
MNKKGVSSIVIMVVSLLLVLLIGGIILLIVWTGFGGAEEKTEEAKESLFDAVFKSTGRLPSLPDLYIEDTYGEVVDDEYIDFVIIVGNQGIIDAENFDLCWINIRKNIPIIKAGETHEVRILLSELEDEGIIVGTHIRHLKVDCDNEIKEIDETNNRLPGVPPGGPDCGDGFLDEDEECDDGNADDGDGCSSECTYEVEEIWLNPNQRYSDCIDFCPDFEYSGGGECMSESYSYDECIADRGTIVRLTGMPLIFCQRTYGDEPHPLCCCYG